MNKHFVSFWLRYSVSSGLKKVNFEFFVCRKESYSVLYLQSAEASPSRHWRFLQGHGPSWNSFCQRHLRTHRRRSIASCPTTTRSPRSHPAKSRRQSDSFCPENLPSTPCQKAPRPSPNTPAPTSKYSLFLSIFLNILYSFWTLVVSNIVIVILRGKICLFSSISPCFELEIKAKEKFTTALLHLGVLTGTINYLSYHSSPYILWLRRRFGLFRWIWQMKAEFLKFRLGNFLPCFIYGMDSLRNETL